jgi:hypothetical protein
VVDAIEPCLPSWENLGYRVTVRVPKDGPLGFVILKGSPGELMLQSRASVREDLPVVSKMKPEVLLYADVRSIAAAKKALPNAKVLVAERKTFYGATEAWPELPGGTILGLAEHQG